MGSELVSSRPALKSANIQAALIAVLLVWGAAISVASITGALRSLPPVGIAAMIVGGFALPVTAYFSSRSLRLLADSFGLRAITGFQVWRIAAALLFFWYGAHDLLPKVFVERAAWGDLISGLLAGLTVWLWPRRSGYWLVHAFGLVDLIVATATGMALRLAAAPHIENVVSFPVALIPLFGVGLTAASHLVAFDLLRRSAKPARQTA